MVLVAAGPVAAGGEVLEVVAPFLATSWGSQGLVEELLHAANTVTTHTHTHT